MKNKFLVLLGLFWVSIFVFLVFQGVQPRDTSDNEQNLQDTEERVGGVKEVVVTEEENTEPQLEDGEVVEEISPSQDTALKPKELPKKPIVQNLNKLQKQQEEKRSANVTRIEIFPQKVTLKPGGSDIFTATAYNAQEQPVSFSGKWSTNAGKIEYMASNKIKLTTYRSLQSTGWLRCTDKKTLANGDAFIDITEIPRLSRFSIEGLPGTLNAGESCDLRVVAYDQFGDRFPIKPEWNTPAGTISAEGHFVVGNKYGRHEIRLRDRNSGQSISRFVHIQAPLKVIDLYGTEKSLRPGETFQYRAVCFDRYRNEINFPVKWSATGGQVDANGNLTPGEIPGTYEIFVEGIGTDIRVGMYYKIIPIIKSIKIVNIPPFIYGGDRHVFQAVGYDYQNRPLYFEPVWKAGGGQINANGEFLAGNQPGTYNVTVSDGYGVEQTASFVIKAEITEKDFELTGDVLFEDGERVVSIQHATVTIFKTGRFIISYQVRVFQEKSWNYQLLFRLQNNNIFEVNPATVKKRPGQFNFTQRGRSQTIRRTFRNIRAVDARFR
ncbi:hypothetical protein [Candidatus Uabimicrobium amorphum]|uniref:Uncharacterized protein n=1 Tax=Uabimicrobium amorphum TaxID=2596890 RepID=A0A5S9F5K2_UABAM|nr:hypothetical protein [Candidatus Uabimicrobium amorphum]BBM86702.1 hypothetical protein UABAM_05088 [Candidatus Uabimicrobium amorphum]